MINLDVKSCSPNIPHHRLILNCPYESCFFHIPWHILHVLFPLNLELWGSNPSHRFSTTITLSFLTSSFLMQPCNLEKPSTPHPKIRTFRSTSIATTFLQNNSNWNFFDPLLTFTILTWATLPPYNQSSIIFNHIPLLNGT